MPYVASGLSKIRNGGFFWWDAINVKAKLFRSSLNPMEFDWRLSLHLSEVPDVFFSALGLAAIAGELLFFTVLLSRKARLIVPGVMILMHICVLFIQNILFFDLMLILWLFYICHFIENRNPAATVYEPYSTKQHWVAPCSVAGLITVLLLCWGYRVEFYPFTAMQMFSHKNTSGTVTYYKVLGHYESGKVTRAYPEQGIPAMRDTRYRQVLQQCFDPETAPICKKFLQASGDALNDGKSKFDKIKQFDIQKWKWDFQSNRGADDYGKEVDSFVYTLE